MEMTEEEIRSLLKDVFGLTNLLIKESERASVIVAAARIDVDLEKLLKRVLLRSSGRTDDLFESDRALGTFSAKISISYRIGLIDKEFEHALHLLRKMRNDFAHRLEEESLNSHRQKPRLSELVRWAEHYSTFDSAAKMIKSAEKSDEHVKFVACVLSMITEFKKGQGYFNRIYLGPPLSCTVDEYENNRILLTKDKYIEESIKNFLIADDAFCGMKFTVDARDGKVTVVRLPNVLPGEAKTFEYNYTADEKSISKERSKLLFRLKNDVLA